MVAHFDMLSSAASQNGPPSDVTVSDFQPYVDHEGPPPACDRTAPSYDAGSRAAIKPMTALQNGRYGDGEKVKMSSIQVVIGAHSSIVQSSGSMVLPSGWTRHVHPEGAPFYVNSTGPVCVVTDAPLYRHEISAKILASIDDINLLATENGVALPQNCELYIHVDDKDDGCSYYFVDHSCRTGFWLSTVDSESLDMLEVSSKEHLKHVLEEHYWTHVDYFPRRPIAAAVKEELEGILRHGAIDQMSSESSTFPYGAEQCISLLQLIEGSDTKSTYTTCIIARVWVTIARSRYQNFYGQDYARLGCLQRRLDPPGIISTHEWLVKLCSSLLFGIPRTIVVHLEFQYVDNLARRSHWQKFIESIKPEWIQVSALAVAVLITSGIFLNSSGDAPAKYALLMSSVASLSGVMIGCTLLRRYAYAQHWTAEDAAVHLDAFKSRRFGYLPLAVVFSLPQSLMMWSLYLLGAHIAIRAVGVSETLIEVLAVIPAYLWLLFVAVTLAGAKSLRAYVWE
ncbi:uncharacterized protein LAESUDRAFT_759574 [Laetiporus sulphureus 93-53]|uniref:WW domain-containing protein n=1 Tax=Laetiporus sulphureus 93-53 TaxID=1314785 RepID=A0A165E0V8_9APHY|nr:uncharacterized protein LAESUDRAFT_759574 [Laetiporus sulphureus 93-53]KZT06031.1 hypothetical protein LAESUDRAFT_759574 [Laetiporus sulphureus 93-53]